MTKQTIIFIILASMIIGCKVGRDKPAGSSDLKESSQTTVEQSAGPVKSELSKNGHSRIKQSAFANRGYMGLTTRPRPEGFNTEEYDRIYEDNFVATLSKPLSTFSIDVDTASYANVRRFINSSRKPPKDAARIEEFINYFTYDYPQPEEPRPFSVVTELSDCPWNASRKLIHIGVQGRNISKKNLPPSNLVFLLDVSGSMSSPDKLPLLQRAFRLLVRQLGHKDRVSVAVYAGAAGVVLPPTSGDNKKAILKAINRLSAGGSTAGGQGIQLAYKLALQNFIKKGNNRIILATDGDFNVGMSSDGELTRLVEKKRNQGVFLTVLGFGTGNYKDSKMEKLADKGNGNYAYIDGLLEAKKVLVNELAGTIMTIAKDVKIQVEFNPLKVKAYRLLGYENRKLAKEDFKDDSKDAGELGAGHSVTALYEIIPADSKENAPSSPKLKYQETKISPQAKRTNEVMTVKLRYKKPTGEKSILITKSAKDKWLPLNKSSNNFKFSAAAAEFGLLLRDSKFKSRASYDQVLKLAKESKGKDPEGYRAEFIKLVETVKLLEESKK